jgi:hypothetical protein
MLLTKLNVEQTDFEKFSVTLFLPGHGQADHLYALIAACDAARNASQASDDESDDEHDSEDDEDLLELTQGAPSWVLEAMVIEVGLHRF